MLGPVALLDDLPPFGDLGTFDRFGHNMPFFVVVAAVLLLQGDVMLWTEQAQSAPFGGDDRLQVNLRLDYRPQRERKPLPVTPHQYLLVRGFAYILV